MLRRLHLLHLLLATAIYSAAAGAAAAPLRIGVEAYDEPLSFLNAAGRPDGFTAELISAMQAHGLGEVKITADWWTHLVGAFREGKLDVLANVSIMEETQRDMDFSISHVLLHGVVYSLKERPAIVSVHHFPNRKIAVVSGGVAWSTAVANAGWGASLTVFQTLDDALAALRAGTCDGILQVFAFDRKFQQLRAPEFRREMMWDITHHLSFAVRKGDSATLANLNGALAEVIRDGQLERMYERWIGSAESRQIGLRDLRPHAPAIIAALLVVIAVVVWQRRMLSQLSRHTQSLRETEQLFESVIDSTLIGWVIHRNGVLLKVNPKAAELAGATPDKLVGHKLLEFIAPQASPAAAAVIDAGTDCTTETVLLRNDGTTLVVEVVGRSCSYRGQPARIVSMRDLSAQRQAAADQLAISKLESTGILAGGIAHDFNNFLATIGLNLDLLIGMPGMPEPGLGRLKVAKQATLSAKTLVGQLVACSRGDTGHPVPTDLKCLLSGSVIIPLVGSNCRADLVVAADLWTIRADPVQLERVVHNLVLNAREAMPAGGTIRISARNVTLRSGEIAGLLAGPHVLIEVVDQGMGIPEHILSRIFDPYFSTKQRDTKKGMGLGLTICQRVIQQHGGTIAVRSKPGTGTAFLIHLPASPDLPAPAEKPAPSPVFPLTSSASVARQRILVMDDEEMLLEALGMTLTRFGYDVETAEDGNSAMEKFILGQQESRPFSAVMLDLTVRGNMGGLEAIKGLRRIDPTLRAVLVSGHAEQDLLREHARFGFDAALTKPFGFDELRDVLHKLLRT